MSALVSILIPAYNVEPTVAETLESAVSQMWPSNQRSRSSRLRYIGRSDCDIHADFPLSLENSPRTGDTRVTYLPTWWFTHCSPEKSES